MTTWNLVINEIEMIIDSTDWNDINSPADTVTLIEAKAYLMKAVTKITKVVEREK